MHGVGFDVPVMEWFDFNVPKPTVAHNFIESCLSDELLLMTKSSAKPIWLGNQPIVDEVQENKKGEKRITLTIHTFVDRVDVSLEMNKGTWLVEQLEKMSVHSEENPTFAALKSDYEAQFDDFEPFWYSKELTELKEAGLLV